MYVRLVNSLSVRRYLRRYIRVTCRARLLTSVGPTWEAVYLKLAIPRLTFTSVAKVYSISSKLICPCTELCQYLYSRWVRLSVWLLPFWMVVCICDCLSAYLSG